MPRWRGAPEPLAGDYPAASPPKQGVPETAKTVGTVAIGFHMPGDCDGGGDLVQPALVVPGPPQHSLQRFPRPSRDRIRVPVPCLPIQSWWNSWIGGAQRRHIAEKPGFQFLDGQAVHDLRSPLSAPGGQRRQARLSGRLVQAALEVPAVLLNHVREVVPGLGEPLLGAGLRNSPGVVGGEVGEIPARDEPAEGADPGMPGELAERVDGQELPGLQPLLNPLFSFIRRLAGDGEPRALGEVQEDERAPALPGFAGPSQPFMGDIRPLLVLVNLESKTVDFPLPFGPRRTVSGERSSRWTSLKAR